MLTILTFMTEAQPEQIKESLQRDVERNDGVLEFSTTEQAIKYSEKNSMKYQTCTLVALFICGLAVASFGSLLSYQTIEPNMLCSKVDANPPSYHSCPMELACSADYTSKVDTTTSIINWMVDYKLLCKQSYLTNVMIYIFFGGCLLSAITISPLSDKIGRKNTLLIIMIAYVVITLKAITSDDYISLIFVLIASGWFIGSFYNVGIMLIIECVSLDHRATYATFLFSSSPVGGFIVAPLFNKFRDWKIVSAIIAVSALVFCISLLFVIESPRFHAATKNYKQAEKATSHFIYWNSIENSKVKIMNNDMQVSSQLKMKERIIETYNLGELFKYRGVAAVTYKMVICSFIFNNMYLGMVLNSEQIILSNYYNAMVTAFLDFIACIIAGSLLQKYGRGAIIPKFHYCSCTLAVLLAFLGSIPVTYHAIVLIVNRFLSLIVLNGGYLYAIEAFPTQIRGKGIGLCSVFACLGKILAYLVTNMGHKFTYIFGIIGLVGFVSLSCLPTIDDMGKEILTDSIDEMEHGKKQRRLMAEPEELNSK